MSGHGLSASFYTLGCRLNQAETALVRDTFRNDGYELVRFGEKSDVCIINSCTVTDNADVRCRKLVRQVLRNNPDTYIAVIGCYAQTGAEELSKIDGIDLIVGTQDKLNVLNFIDEPVKRAEPRIVMSKMTRAPFTIDIAGADIPTTRANIKIQDGCNFMCSFCIIPFARGRARSRALPDIMREAMALADNGFRELILTGVNIGTYEFEGKTFLDLVQSLTEIPGIERVRITSIEPTTIPVELLDFMAESDVLCSHLHIPLQSGSDKVLRDMKRLYNRREFIEFIELAAERVPDILIGTDIIVGFPTESEQDFLDSCDVLENSPLTYAHVFTYSERTGTAAQKFAERVPPQVKKERSRILHRISEQQKTAWYQRFVGRTVRVLTEEVNREGLRTGFSDNYIRVALLDAEQLSSNELVHVRITGVQGEYALADVVSSADHQRESITIS